MELGQSCEARYGSTVYPSGTMQPQSCNYEGTSTYKKKEQIGIPPFWLGRERVYAEFSSPEDEDNTYESGWFRKKRPIEVLIYDHYTKSLKISTGLGELSSTKHIILRLPDRSTKPIHIYKECITTDAAKWAPVFRAFRKVEGHEPDDMAFKGVVHLNKLSWAGRLKIKTGQIRWLFFVNLLS